MKNMAEWRKFRKRLNLDLRLEQRPTSYRLAMRNDDHTSRKWQGRPGSRGVAHAAWGGAIEHENYSPPLEGCRVGLFPTGRPTPKADAFCPSLEGIFMGVMVQRTLIRHRLISRIVWIFLVASPGMMPAQA